MTSLFLIFITYQPLNIQTNQPNGQPITIVQHRGVNQVGAKPIECDPSHYGYKHYMASTKRSFLTQTYNTKIIFKSIRCERRDFK